MKGFQYVTLRCVPRADREEFVNVGVVLYCQDAGFLGSASHVEEHRLRALHPDLDVGSVESALAAVAAVCRGEGQEGFGLGTRATSEGTRELADDLGTRFGFLKAARSTVVRPGPVHGGLTDDPERELHRLLAGLVR